MLSRRNFLKNAGSTGALALLPAVSFAGRMVTGNDLPGNINEEIISLDGNWLFRFDPDQQGESGKWSDASAGNDGWETVTVPSTWQIDPKHTDYFGIAWYKKSFSVPRDWNDKTVRVEFEAVYHTAKVWLNGVPVGEHIRKGYTAFFIDLTKAIKINAVNTLVVMADNHFEDKMLPRNHSYDWAADGGITRPVSLHVTARTYIESAMITALPDIEKNTASIAVSGIVKNGSGSPRHLEIAYSIVEEKSGKIVARQAGQSIVLPAGGEGDIKFPVSIVRDPALWHFDHPDLYSANLFLYADNKLVHSYTSIFGIKKIEVKNAGFYLNGERVWLMGVERMAGSNPKFGMAEPGHWIEHDHRDMKALNCVYSRVHWQQDKRVLDFCDRQGILIQLEVPTWGSDTFSGMTGEPDPAIMQNGLEQLKEQIYREYNHPCIFSWGLCNEINGQNPPAYHFAENMLKAAKALDPHRLCSYASNSLQKDPGKDVSRLMDFVEWNEYYESWYGGTVSDMEKTLESIHEAFPDKPIVISEYGWCFCTPDRKIDDPRRIEIMRTHDETFRRHDYVGGLIFFCYNDYRTHIGDKGIGPLKQRIHGVVDLYGARKPSWEALRKESGPVASLEVHTNGEQYTIAFKSRETIPAYTLRGYSIRCIAYAGEDIPLEEVGVPLPDLRPGESITREISFLTKNIEKVKVDILRPTGYSAITAVR